jgi:hypothetical protein
VITVIPVALNAKVKSGTVQLVIQLNSCMKIPVLMNVSNHGSLAIMVFVGIMNVMQVLLVSFMITRPINVFSVHRNVMDV